LYRQLNEADFQLEMRSDLIEEESESQQLKEKEEDDNLNRSSVMQRSIDTNRDEIHNFLTERDERQSDRPVTERHMDQKSSPTKQNK
jgi:hypothetical protein